jgi:hypothetical protein
VIASGPIVYTGPTRELGSDIDAFEERLIGLLTGTERLGAATFQCRAE